MPCAFLRFWSMVTVGARDFGWEYNLYLNYYFFEVTFIFDLYHVGCTHLSSILLRRNAAFHYVSAVSYQSLSSQLYFRQIKIAIIMAQLFS